MLKYSNLDSQHNWVDLYSHLKKLENLHFDNKKSIYMTSSISLYEENGDGLNLGL